MFNSWHNVILWGLPLFLAIFLRVGMWLYGKLRKEGEGEGGQGIFVGCRLSSSAPAPLDLTIDSDFLAIPAIFYVVVLASGLSLDTLRDEGWVFDIRGGDDGVGWYKFYDYFGNTLSPLPNLFLTLCRL